MTQQHEYTCTCPECGGRMTARDTRHSSTIVYREWECSSCFGTDGQMLVDEDEEGMAL